MTSPTNATRLSDAELVASLKSIGEERYHHQHPFHRLMHEGKLNRGQLQAWALNRYCYQRCIPEKDAAILEQSDDLEFRRVWQQRVIDHEGENGHPGGIERWLRLVEATGLKREEAIHGKGVLPAVRYAVDAYLNLVKRKTLLEAVASSLTEMFAGSLIALRLGALRRHYPWLENGLVYFEARVNQAPADAEFALGWVLRHACTFEEQELACNALRAKCDILWAQLDAIYFAYVRPGWPPPGAFRIPEKA